jgi:hypothetical protein
MEPIKRCPQVPFLALNLQIWFQLAKRELLRTPEVRKGLNKREKPMLRLITIIFLNSNIQ